MSNHIAIDLGAESGRVAVGTIADGRIALQVFHRFPTVNRMVDGHLRWDAPTIFASIKEGLAKVAASGLAVASVGVCTWGVDYGLIDERGELVELPCQYRDARCQTGMDVAHKVLGPEALFARTGVPSQSYNTLYQLVAHKALQGAGLAKAKHLLFMPDLMHYWLSGVVANEHAIAGTSMLMKPGTNQWDRELIDLLGLPQQIFGTVVAPGTVLGPMKAELAKELGFASAPLVVAPAGHDTACAAAASPGDVDRTAFLSSGTWSILGVITPTPVTTPAALAAGFTNEVAADGRVRFNRNIMGLWLIQECRKGFAAAGREYSYAQLADLAAAVPAGGPVLAVDDPVFLPPGEGEQSMDNRVRRWLIANGHGAPASDGHLIRAVVDGLAAAYAAAVRGIAAATGRTVETVHIIGGGSQHTLLSQLTATAAGVPVVTGPVEATALGNILVQARGLKVVPDAAAGCALIRASADTATWQPR